MLIYTYCVMLQLTVVNLTCSLYCRGLSTVRAVPVFESRAPGSRWTSIHVLYGRATAPQNVSAAGGDDQEHLAAQSLLSILRPPQRVQEILQDGASNQLHQGHARLYPFYFRVERFVYTYRVGLPIVSTLSILVLHDCNF